MLRSVGAIVVGFVVIGVLASATDAATRAAMPMYVGPGGRVDHVGFLLFTQAYVLAFAVLGCWLTARLAPSRPMRHALILGALGLAFNVAGTAVLWHTAPAWYHVVALALVMPAAWLGGWLRERQLAARGGATLAAA